MEDIRMPVAGAGATAVGCAILGLKTQAVTTVGDDEMGDFLVAKMEKFGVDCHMVARDGSVQTSATILPVRANGRPFMFPEPWRRSRCRRTSSMPRSTRDCACRRHGPSQEFRR
jgi:sugar/nucleoside kinase (ribokinase family)